jgi:hypothetical protein
MLPQYFNIKINGNNRFVIICEVIVHLLGNIQDKKDARYMFYRGADKSLARPGRKQATASEDFDVHISYL